MVVQGPDLEILGLGDGESRGPERGPGLRDPPTNISSLYVLWNFPFMFHGCNYLGLNANCLWSSLTSRVKGIDFTLNDRSNGGDNLVHEFDDCKFIRITSERCFERFTICNTHVGIDIYLGYANFDCINKIMIRRAAATMQRDIAIKCVTDTP
jgi:hypothetical protein